DNFREVFSAAPERQLFLVRRTDPLPNKRRSHLLRDCWATTTPAAAGSVAEHVLFYALYQNLAVGEPATDTFCSTTVPEDGVLRFGLGVRMPETVSPKAEVPAEIWILPEMGSTSPATRLFHVDQPVVPIS